MHDPWTDRLSEYVDGDLDAGEKAAIEAHLGQCLACREVLAGLRDVTHATAGLVDREPVNDLWPGILGRIRDEARTEQADAVATVLPLRPAERSRRFSFSAPQLLAASLAMMTVSGGAVWLALRADPTATEPTARVAVATTQETLDPEAAVLISSVTREYDQAIDQLEREFDARRDRLDPETVRVVEESLRVIDDAIAEARAALMRDPANGYLYRHLDQTLTRKVDLLRRAAGVALVST